MSANPILRPYWPRQCGNPRGMLPIEVAAREMRMTERECVNGARLGHYRARLLTPEDAPTRWFIAVKDALYDRVLEGRNSIAELRGLALVPCDKIMTALMREWAILAAADAVGKNGVRRGVDSVIHALRRRGIRVTQSTLYRWRQRYAVEGLLGLVPRYKMLEPPPSNEQPLSEADLQRVVNSIREIDAPRMRALLAELKIILRHFDLRDHKWTMRRVA